METGLQTPETALVVGVSQSSSTRRLLLVTNVVQTIPAINDVQVEVVPLDQTLTGAQLSEFTDVWVELDANFPRLATGGTENTGFVEAFQLSHCKTTNTRNQSQSS